MATNKNSTQPPAFQAEIALPDEEEKLRKQRAYQDRVMKRQEERKAKMQQRKMTNEHKQEETADFFWKEFNQQQSDINSLFEQFSSSIPAPTTLFKEIDCKLEALQKYMNDSTLFLSPFDLRIAQSTLQKFQSDLAKERTKHVPKFGFKKRPKKVQNGNSENPNSQSSPVFAEKTIVELPVSKNSFILKDRNEESIVINPDDISHKDLLITNLNKCHLMIQGNPTTVHMSNISNCKLAIGPISTSIMMHNSTESVFFLACQQLRIHTSEKDDFYIHVTSRAIIEDCSKLRFAPYTWTYPAIHEDYVKSGLDVEVNNWQLINDFHWLSISEASPNWCQIPPQERVDWQNV